MKTFGDVVILWIVVLWRLFWCIPLIAGRLLCTLSVYMMWGEDRARKVWSDLE
jgi:hypothetical protein